MSERALEGLKVIDLTRVLGGPYCTMILADHGAEVIKVEPPQGDEVRDWGPPFLTHEDGSRDASYFLGVNRNKRAIALDMARPEGRNVLLRLLDGADVVIDNFKPGSMERWGIGPDVLAGLFPRLVQCRISGFGAVGPLGGLPGYDAILQAMTGLMSVNGEPATGPLRIGTPVIDMATGLYAAIGILIALRDRERSGLGQFVDMTLHDCGMALLHPQAANYFLDGRRPQPLGNPHPNITPYTKFATATGDIFLCIGNDAQFRTLCVEIERADLGADPRFASNARRNAERGALTAELNAALRDVDGWALADRLLRAGVPAGPVLPVDEALVAPHTAARDMVVDVGGVRGLGTPIKLSRTPGGPRQRPPRFAEHGRAILAEAGYTEAEMDMLQREGVAPAARRR